MDWVQDYQNLSTKEKEQFRDVLNRLVSSSFVVKGQEQGRHDYYFVERNFNTLKGYLSVLGWDVNLDRAYGVCHLTTGEATQGLNLTLIQTILLLILRLLFEEERKQLKLTQDVVVSVEDVQMKYLALQIRNRPLEKGVLRDSFALYKRHNIVDVLDGDVTDPECRIRIHPSILFAVKADNLIALYSRLAEYRTGSGKEEGDAPADEAPYQN